MSRSRFGLSKLFVVIAGFAFLMVEMRNMKWFEHPQSAFWFAVVFSFVTTAAMLVPKAIDWILGMKPNRKE